MDYFAIFNLFSNLKKILLKKKIKIVFNLLKIVNSKSNFKTIL